MHKISAPKRPLEATIIIPASKSETNRALIINALCNNKCVITNVSASDDSIALENGLANYENSDEINIGHAGTSFRFLTAFLTLKTSSPIVLTGSDRMKQRPCGELVDALNSLGGNIEYLSEEGYPPIQINPSEKLDTQVFVRGDISSQFISALMLIAPMLDKGLHIHLTTELTSKPYLEMTAQIMRHFGAQVVFSGSTIAIDDFAYVPRQFTVEGDWSSASYWFEMLAFNGGKLKIKHLKKSSLQGDSHVKEIYAHFGISYLFEGDTLILEKTKKAVSSFNYDFSDCPDLAQTVACTMAGLNIPGKLTGLKTLRIKETDRIHALCTELSKLGVNIEEGEDYITINPSGSLLPAEIETYHDHRMALAFAPLASATGKIHVKEPSVITKSYGTYWMDLQSAGYQIE